MQDTAYHERVHHARAKAAQGSPPNRMGSSPTACGGLFSVRADKADGGSFGSWAWVFGHLIRRDRARSHDHPAQPALVALAPLTRALLATLSSGMSSGRMVSTLAWVVIDSLPGGWGRPNHGHASSSQLHPCGYGRPGTGRSKRCGPTGSPSIGRLLTSRSGTGAPSDPMVSSRVSALLRVSASFHLDGEGREALAQPLSHRRSHRTTTAYLGDISRRSRNRVNFSHAGLTVLALVTCP